MSLFRVSRIVVMLLTVIFAVSLCSIANVPDGRVIYVEIHDVSPAYNISWLVNIVDVIERHRSSNLVVFLMVVPNHKGVNPLTGNPDYTFYLKTLKYRGYRICMHGCAHEKGEFQPSDVDRDRISQGLRLFEDSGLGRPACYCPPWWKVGWGENRLLREYFSLIFYMYYVWNDSKLINAPMHEYTNGLSILPSCGARYLYSLSHVFRVVVHIEVGGDVEKLRKLDQILSSITLNGG